MATETQQSGTVHAQPLVKITEMDHIVLRNRDVETSLRFYTEVLGMQPERIDQWRAGEVRFPSARLNDDTIIDFFGSDQAPIGKEDSRNQKPSSRPWESKFRAVPAPVGVPMATVFRFTSTTRTTTWWSCATTRSTNAV